MTEITVTELVDDTRQYLSCLAPHVRQRKAALLLSRLVDEIEQLQRAAILRDEMEKES